MASRPGERRAGGAPAAFSGAPPAASARAEPEVELPDPIDRDPPEPPEAPGAKVEPSPAALGLAQQRFAYAFHRELGGKPSDSTVFSPLSLHLALTMLYGAAAGETAAELRRALGLPDDPMEPHGWYRSYLAWSRQDRTGGEKGLRLGNRLWTSGVAPEYRDLLAGDYGAGFSPLSGGDPKARIDRWIAWVTRGRIKRLPFALTPGTGTVLVNALLLDLAWASPFSEKRTKPGPFRVDFAREEPRELMHGGMAGRYASEGGVEYASLPYKAVGRASWRLLVAVPEGPGQLGEAERRAIGETSATLAALRPAKLRLVMPKFRIDFASRVRWVLYRQGIEQAMDPQRARLPGISGEMYVEDVVHGASIEVKESGTIAAAATVITVGGISDDGVPTVELVVDRPFFYALVDEATGVVVVAGRYAG
ncbi:MAG: hypothetical protein IT376_12615 [Polyangiaceae bacterium]|nr:hypothetical protein [Polyangiaceae bacterium]